MNLKTIPETKAENETENTMKYRLKTKAENETGEGWNEDETAPYDL